MDLIGYLMLGWTALSVLALRVAEKLGVLDNAEDQRGLGEGVRGTDGVPPSKGGR